MIGSSFSGCARQFLYLLYEDFKRVGSSLEEALESERRSEDAGPVLQRLNPEYEGDEVSLNNRAYLLWLALITQLREGHVGRSAPDKLPTPTFSPG